MPKLMPDWITDSTLSRILIQYKKEFLIVGLFSGVSNLIMLAPTIYMLQMFDRVMLSRSELTLLVVSVVILFFYILMAVVEWSRTRVLVRAGIRFDQQVSNHVFNASFESALQYRNPTPAKSLSDLTELRQFLTGQGIFAFFDAPWTPIYLAILFILHPVLGWVALGFAIAQLAYAVFFSAKVVTPQEHHNDAQNDELRFLGTKLRGAELLESMGMLDKLKDRWLSKRIFTRQRHKDYHGLTHKLAAASKLIKDSHSMIVLSAAAILVINGEITPGAMIAANMLASRALAPIDMLVSGWSGFLTAKQAYIRLDQLLQEFPEKTTELSRVPPQGSLSLRNVVATATGRQEPILKNISLEVPSGSVTVVVGPSGSGKSTLARVMMGIWPSVSGEVLLDQRPLSGWDRNELGPYLGYLPQDVEMFDGSVAENISRFGELDNEKIVAAARLTNLHELILRMPKGYDTPIGVGGGLLSGGQRQRIGLARAVYGDPRLLVLDEPNANLDEVGEQALAATIEALRAQQKTVVVVSHRPSLIKLADQVCVLKNGEIQHFGPAAQVLAKLA